MMPPHLELDRVRAAVVRLTAVAKRERDQRDIVSAELTRDLIDALRRRERHLTEYMQAMQRPIL